MSLKATTREDQIALAEKIKSYWKERGHIIRVTVGGFAPYEITSNLVNGIPPYYGGDEVVYAKPKKRESFNG